MAKLAAAPVFDDDPWGFGESDGVLVEVRAQAPATIDDALTLSTPAPAPELVRPKPAPAWTRFQVAMATIAAAVTASLATAAVTWWMLQPPALPIPIVGVPAPATAADVAVDGGARQDLPPESPTPLASMSSNAHLATAAAPSAAEFGAVAFEGPFDLGVYRQGRFIGAAESTPLRVPVGTHTFELVNERLGFRTWQTLDIAAGKTTRRVVPNLTAPSRSTCSRRPK